MSILDRYLAREILLPLAAGLVFLTQLLLAIQLLGQAEVLFGSGVSTWDVLSMGVYLVPHLLGFVLPVAFLLGAVLGVGRLVEDRELVALAAAGISPVRLVRVPLLLGVLATAAALALAGRVEPAALSRAGARLNEIIKKNISSDVRPGIFYEDIPGLTLYAGQVSGGRWRHVLVSDRSDPAAPILVLAGSGRLEAAAPNEAMSLVLQGGEIHREEAAGDYVVATFRQGSLAVGLGQMLGERNRYADARYEMQPEEVWALAQQARERSPERARELTTSFYRRLAKPLAILAFALLAVPVATLRRAGRAFGYGATMLAVVAFYALMRLGEGLSLGGRLPPWLGPNLGSLVLAAVGLALTALLARRGAGAVR